jgi:hypothetical protein
MSNFIITKNEAQVPAYYFPNGLKYGLKTLSFL